MKPNVRQTYTLTCPACGEHEFDVSHMMDRPTPWGPWHCKVCGVGIHGQALGDGTFAGVEATDERRTETIVALTLDPETMDGPVELYVEGMRFHGGRCPDDDRPDSDRYFYEEHTCPTNYLHHTHLVVAWDDPDPHGLFDYVGTLELTDDVRERLFNMANKSTTGVSHKPARDIEEALNALTAEQLRGLFKEPTDATE